MVLAQFALVQGHAGAMALCVTQYHCHVSGADGCLLFESDEPYWAMTSVAVVSFPTVGGVISKSLGRIAGSLLGAIAALLLAGHTLNEPWFFY